MTKKANERQKMGVSLKAIINYIRLFIIYAAICAGIPLAWSNAVLSDQGQYKVWSENLGGNEVILFKNRNWGDGSAVQLSHLNGLNVTPVVLEDDNALIWVLWANIHADQSALFYSTSQGGIEWSTPKKVPTGIKNNSAPFLVLDGDNGLWLFWSGNQEDTPDDIFSAKWNGNAWGKPLKVHPANSYPDILPHAQLNLAGELGVTWLVLTQNGYKAQTATFSQSQWSLQKTNALKTKFIDSRNSSQTDNSSPLPTQLFNRLLENQSPEPSENPNEKQEDSAETNQNYDEFFLTFGDSITWGSGGHGYQGELSRILLQNGRRAKLYNLGKIGETTVEGINRLVYYLAEIPADFLLLLEGTNDIRFGISQQVTLANLSAMVDKSVAADVEPIISNLTPDTTNGNYNRAIANSYNPKIKALANQKNLTLADQYAALAPNWSGYTDDGLHPNNAGYNVMAKIWYDAIVILGQKPVVKTRAPAEVQATNAVLSALITPNGAETRCYFEYGTGEQLTQNSEEVPLGAEEPETPIEIAIHGLERLTKYRYRAVAINETGKKSGEIKFFTTIEEDPDSGGSGCFVDTLSY